MSASAARELATECLRAIDLLRTRDASGLAAAHEAFAATNPRRRAGEARSAEESSALREWIDTWDAVLHAWVLADDAPEELWGPLILPDARGRFARGHWALMAMWLREVGSERAGDAALPEDLAALSRDEQARALGRFCLRCDGVAPIDYRTVHDALAPDLRPFLAHWALAVHLCSPVVTTDRVVGDNRRALAAGFAEAHAEEDLPLAPDAMRLRAVFGAVYHTPDPIDFLSVLFDRALAPRIGAAIEHARRAVVDERRRCEANGRKGAKNKGAKGKAAKRPARGGSQRRAPRGVGVLLSCFGANQAVRRCTEPLLADLRDAGELRGYYPGGDRHAALAELGSAWAGPNARLVAAKATPLHDAIELGGRIAADELDLLFLPEIGISGISAVLATRRLARVQATTYGHPVTSGSRAIDYFVSGADLEHAPLRYRERLVLLPGLGVASTPPPEPTRGRERPVDEERCRFASLSTISKLHDGLLDAWRGALETAGEGRAELVHFPAAQGRARDVTEALVRSALGDRVDYALRRGMHRRALLAELSDCDVLLDSFPFAGFNTLVDALSVGVPAVTLRRPGLAGGIGAAVMTRLGCEEECVAESEAEYVAKAARLAADPGLRRDLRERLPRERVLSVLCDPAVGAHFRAAVEWMRAEGPGSTGPPVRIEAGEPPRVLTAD